MSCSRQLSHATFYVRDMFFYHMAKKVNEVTGLIVYFFLIDSQRAVRYFCKFQPPIASLLSVISLNNFPILYYFWPKEKNQDKYFWPESLSFLGEQPWKKTSTQLFSLGSEIHISFLRWYIGIFGPYLYIVISILWVCPFDY